MAKIVCVIFARGGSKGLPGKNLRQINNRTLLEIAISHALQTRGVTEVFVSTDSQEIADLAVAAGARIPFLRPAELAEDTSPEWKAWQHSLRELVPREELEETFLLTVPTTAPLRLISDIEGCVSVATQAESLDGAICVTRSKVHPDFNLLREKEGSTFAIFSKTPGQHLPFRRQDAETAWEIVPSAYCMRASFVMNSNSMWEGNLGGYEIPPERSIDIDSEYDLIVARAFSQGFDKNYIRL